MSLFLGAGLAALLMASTQVEAPSCAALVEVGDTLAFNPRELTIDSQCRSFTLTLRHTGTMPASTMGHNWVLTRTEDLEGAAMDGQRSGAQNEYIRPGDERVLAATRVIGGGEEVSISFSPSVLEPGGDYSFFCSFPAHFMVMRGKVIVT